MKMLARISWAYATLVIFTGMTLMITIFKIVPKPYAQKIASKFIQLLTFWSYKKIGTEDPQTQMFLVNHQSDLDIGVMELLSKRDLAWVAKKELFDIPFFGLTLRLPNDIPIERESKSSLVKLLKASKERLDEGRVITIFPEGTRSSTGKMLPFKPGAKLVADKYALCVQPVVLIATASCYNIKKYYYRPRKIKAIFLDSFIADKEDKDWMNNLRTTMQKVYDHELANNTSNR
ncbi:MAG: lysophospholipid acyltransferase family protein [Thiovulaceae bacterium]|nr:lysophospholipid acyltransferase family protein [Sulfurimonadaceae bacterium]